MTNLQYLQKFVTETFGAICFYNERIDGYREFSVESNKKMETLAVYFPSRFDLEMPTVKSRLENAAGKDFYKRYKGSSIRLPAISGSYLFTSVSYKNQVLDIDLDRAYVGLHGGISFVVRYFLGKLPDDAVVERMNYPKPVKTNNDFLLPVDANVKEYVEKYLQSKGLPLVTKENGFFVREFMPLNDKGAMIENNPHKEIMEKLFSEDWKRVEKIMGERARERMDAFVKMNKQDWEELKEEIGVHLVETPKNNAFDD